MSTVALSITICLTLICAPSCPATAQTSALPPQEQAFRNVPKAVRCGSVLTVHLLSLLSDEDTLDELPQFFNVLRGNMSVVGPRPERPHFVKRFLDEISRYDSRHRLKVSITGWVQAKGWRGNTSIQKRFEFGLYYLQNWSFWFDLRIILLSVFSGMLGKNAY